MVRNSLIGTLVFGSTAALAGYLWTALEFPFVIVLPGLVGFFVLARMAFGTKRALTAGLVGGFGFTASFLVGLFVSITDGSPFSIPAWVAAAIAGALAGALAGSVVAGKRGAYVLASYSAAGTLVGVMLAGVVQTLAPAAAQSPGAVQYSVFALAIGLVGASMGGFIGAGISRLVDGDNREPGAHGSQGVPAS